MTLFQNSVLKRHLKGLDNDLMIEKYEAFSQYFLHPTIQDNIRASKEEQFQATFLNELFVKILGYTLNPSLNYNLTTEYKNVKDAKKADGAIIQNEKAIAVIELKGTNTTNLDKVESQAFGYKNNQPDAVYIITSNFEKLRFYIDNAVDYEEFNLFHLSFERFKTLWLCLAKDNIFTGLPKRVKDNSLLEEENITKHLYKDYSAFRNDIFNSVVKLNPEFDKLILFKKTQKLLDRFLFIFFAEDGGLLPPNSIKTIIDEWTKARDGFTGYQPLYDFFKFFFKFLDKGNKQHDIFAYNGGLFKPDAILDNIKIDDVLLYTHTQKLSAYDFKSEVDVNILGHIFEHSLNEIEEMTAEIEGTAVDKSKTKRKKDGVFYTPKYITKYIVENTVGQLCEDKKAEIGIDEAEYNKSRKGRKKETLIKLKDQLETYRTWLLGLTICDPACGSGAFLNQALSFLIEEHTYIDELQTKLLGGGFVFPNVENAILENNLYGVDINNESVDIAKLSLWLRSAKPQRKLTSLNSNIKCGNSLIDDPTIAGDKAFNWQTAFPKVFRPKDKEAYHIVLTTHNSRTSERMKQFKVEKDEPVELSLEEEIELTKIIGEVIKEYGYQCLAYNVCKDHVHLVLVCEFEELSKQIQRLKSIASRKFNILTGKTIPQSSRPMGHDPLSRNKGETVGTMGHDPLDKKKKTQNHLWSQKFFYANLDVWELATLSKRAGYTYDDPYIGNAIQYIQNNRIKHQLPASDALQKLIDDFTVSAEKAFELEYEGGFDVVIGNPPYVRNEYISLENKDHLSKNYKTFTGKSDLYVFFFEKSYNILKKKGLVGFIVSSKYTKTKYGKKLISFLNEYVEIDKFIDFRDLDVFKGIIAYPSIILYKKLKRTVLHQSSLLVVTNDNDTEINNNFLNFVKTKQIELFDRLGSWNSNQDGNILFDLLKKLKSNSANLKELNLMPQVGIKTGFNNGYIFNNDEINNGLNDSPLLKDYILGKNVKRFTPIDKTSSILLPYELKEERLRLVDIEKYNIAFQYLSTKKERLSKRAVIDKGIERGTKQWYELQQINLEFPYSTTFIIYPDISEGVNFTLATNTYFDMTCFGIPSSSLELVGILNSSLIKTILEMICVKARGGYLRLKSQYMLELPIPAKFKNEKLEKLVLFSLEQNRNLYNKINRFLSRIQTNFEIEKLSKKLESFYDYNFKTFLSELKKKKIQLKLSEQDEWEDYFNDYKTGINQLQAEIAKTDKEIDAMVYELYGLTEDEIKIVEGI